MITLISLHNHTSTKIAITVNPKENCSLTPDMVTSDIKSHVVTLEKHLLVDIFPCKKTKTKQEQKQENCSLNMSVLLFFGKNSFWNILWEKHKMGLWHFEEQQSSKVETLHFQNRFSIFLLSTQSQLSTTGDGKDVPFNSWAGTRSSQLHINNWRLL